MVLLCFIVKIMFGCVIGWFIDFVFGDVVWLMIWFMIFFCVFLLVVMVVSVK